MDYDWRDHYVCRTTARRYNNHWCIWRKRDGKLIKSMPSVFDALRWLEVWGPTRLTGP